MNRYYLMFAQNTCPGCWNRCWIDTIIMMQCRKEVIVNLIHESLTLSNSDEMLVVYYDYSLFLPIPLPVLQPLSVLNLLSPFSLLSPFPALLSSSHLHSIFSPVFITNVPMNDGEYSQLSEPTVLPWNLKTRPSPRFSFLSTPLHDILWRTWITRGRRRAWNFKCWFSS